MATVNLSDVKAPAGAKKVTFRTKHAKLRLIRKSIREIRNHHGELISREEGVKYEFQNGVLDVYEGQDVMADAYDAEARAIVEQDAVSWLRNHPNLDSRRTGGFHEEGREPGRPLPTDQDVLEEITTAAMLLDADVLEAVIDREQATHKRPVLIQAATSALEKVLAADGATAAPGTAENVAKPAAKPQASKA